MGDDSLGSSGCTLLLMSSRFADDTADAQLGPLLEDVLAERRAARLRTRIKAQRVMQINGCLALLYGVDVVRALAAAEGARTNAFLPLLGASFAIGVYLVSRPVPRYPVRAAIGSVLTVGGGVWWGLATTTTALTWLFLYDLLPLNLFDWVTAIGAHEPGAGLLVLGVGLWATATGTWRRQQRRQLVLYDPSEEESSETPPRS